MIRKLAVLGATVAVPLALIIPSSGAASPPVDASNNTVTCNTINKGTLKIKPPLVNGGATPAVIAIAGKLGGCSNDAGVTIPDFKSGFKGTISTPNNDCGGLLGPSTATGTVTIKWAAVPKLTNAVSTVTVNSGSVTTGLFSAAWGGAYGYFGLGVNSRPSGSAGVPLTVSGAFTGGDNGNASTADTVTQEDVAVILGQCAGAGVKALTIGLGEIHLG